MSLLLRLALRNVFRNYLRSVVTLFVIGAGCAALIVNAGVVFNIFRELREDAIWGRYAHLQVYRRGYSQGHRAEPERYLIPPAEARRLIALARADPRIAHATRRREFSGMVSVGSRYTAFLGVGVEPEMDGEFSRHTELRLGQPLTVGDAYGVLAGMGLAQKMGADTGAELRLITTTGTGAFNAVHARLLGVFEGGFKDYDDWTLKAPLGAVEQLLMDDRTEQVVLLLRRTDDAPAVRASLERAFAQEGLDLEIRSWDQLALFHNQVVSLFGRELDVLRLIVCVIVILGIANAVSMSIVDRQFELAATRAMGVGARPLAGLLMTEALLTGLIGAALGVAAGVGIAWAVSQVGIAYPSPPGSTRPFRGGVDLVPHEILTAFSLSVAATVLAAVPPAWRAVRLRIAPALRRG